MYMFLTENIQKNIAQFLISDELNIKINISQNAGCLHGIHSLDEAKNCNNCNNIYNKSDILLSVDRNANKIFFEHFICEIKKIIFDYSRPLKGDYSLWGENYSKIRDIFQSEPDIIKINTELFIIKGLKWLLFPSFLNELSDIQYFNQGCLRIKQTVLTSSYEIDITGSKKIKNNLCLLNTVFNRYSYCD